MKFLLEFFLLVVTLTVASGKFKCEKVTTTDAASDCIADFKSVRNYFNTIQMFNRL
jgi:hypothetical protein